MGLGLGANVLIGGSRRTITLQPLSIEGQIGLNLALGVTSFTLRSKVEMPGDKFCRRQRSTDADLQTNAKDFLWLDDRGPRTWASAIG